MGLRVWWLVVVVKGVGSQGLVVLASGDLVIRDTLQGIYGREKSWAGNRLKNGWVFLALSFMSRMEFCLLEPLQCLC